MQNSSWLVFVSLYIEYYFVQYQHLTALILHKLASYEAKYRIEATACYARQNGNFRSVRIADQCVHAWALMALKPRYGPYAFPWRIGNSFCIKFVASSLRPGLFDRAEEEGGGERQGGTGKRKEKSGISVSSRDACSVLPITQTGQYARAAVHVTQL